MAELREHLKQEYKNSMAIINNKEYIPIEVFESAMYHYALSEAVIGALVMKYGNIEILEKDIINYMTEYTDNVEVKFDNGKYVAKRI